MNADSMEWPERQSPSLWVVLVGAGRARRTREREGGCVRTALREFLLAQDRLSHSNHRGHGGSMGSLGDGCGFWALRIKEFNRGMGVEKVGTETGIQRISK